MIRPLIYLRPASDGVKNNWSSGLEGGWCPCWGIRRSGSRCWSPSPSWSSSSAPTRLLQSSSSYSVHTRLMTTLDFRCSLTTHPPIQILLDARAFPSSFISSFQDENAFVKLNCPSRFFELLPTTWSSSTMLSTSTSSVFAGSYVDVNGASLSDKFSCYSVFIF